MPSTPSTSAVEASNREEQESAVNGDALPGPSVKVLLNLLLLYWVNRTAECVLLAWPYFQNVLRGNYIVSVIQNQLITTHHFVGSCEQTRFLVRIHLQERQAEKDRQRQSKR